MKQKQLVKDVINEKCDSIISRFTVPLTEYGEVFCGDEFDVDAFYESLTQAIIAKGMFEDVMDKYWSPMHVKKFKTFLGRNQSFVKSIQKNLHGHGEDGKQVSPDPPNKVQNDVIKQIEYVKNALLVFHFNKKWKVTINNTIFDQKVNTDNKKIDMWFRYDEDFIKSTKACVLDDRIDSIMMLNISADEKRELIERTKREMDE